MKKQKTSSEHTKEGLRMRELMVATALPKSTILHYVSQGLLPEPVRTGRNTAFYDPACVERARYIKSIQRTYAFPLEKIKKLLASKDQGKDPTSLLELNALVFGTSEGETFDDAALRQATGLTRRQVSELLKAHLLMPLEKGIFRGDDIVAARAYAGAFSLGLKVVDLTFYASIAKELVDQEMHLHQRITGNMPDDQDTRITMDLTRGARTLRNYVIDRVFQHRVAQAKTLKDKVVS
jgi:DNA-binding transcriptional MerR regulator